MLQSGLTSNIPQNLRSLEMIDGLEVLKFDGVELLKKKGNQTKFSSVGTLHVFYFAAYDRFLLYLNDWAYALLKRLPVVRYVKTSTNSFFYVFPSYNGSYIIKVTKCPYREALQNFETILANNSQFSYQGESTSLTPEQVHRFDDYMLGQKESRISNVDKENSSLVGNLSGKEKIHRGFKKIANKFKRPVSSEIHPNVMLVKDYNTLKSSTLPRGFVHSYERRDVEATIVRCKDIAKSLGYGTSIGWNEFEQQSKISESPSVKTQSSPSSNKKSQIYKLSFTPNKSSDIICIEEELAIIKEIERERLFQLEERKLAEKHKILEQYYEIKQRELNDRMTGNFDALKITKAQEKEFIQGIHNCDAIITDLEKRIKTDYPAVSQGQAHLREKLKNELAHLWYQEQLIEAEHLQLQNKMSELLRNYQKKQAELLSIENKKSELFKFAEAKEAEIINRWKTAETERDEIQHENADLNTRARCKFLELMEMEQANEHELEVISIQREELLQLVKTREEERLEFEKKLTDLHHQANASLTELVEKESAIDSQLKELEKKRRELKLGPEANLNELINKLKLKEAEYKELEIREEGVKAAIRDTENDIRRIIDGKKELEETFTHKVTEIQNRTKDKFEEHAELERVRQELVESVQLNEVICKELKSRMNELFSETKRREEELNERQEVLKAEQLELEKKKEEMTTNLQNKILETSMKEKQLDMERLDLVSKTKEIERLQEIYKTETMDIINAIEEVRIRETQFFSHNQDLLLNYQALTKELRKIEKEFKKDVDFKRLQHQPYVESQGFANEQIIGMS